MSPTPSPAVRRPLASRLGLGLGRVYAAMTVAAVIVLRVGGDRWGWATLAAYGPRIVLLAPGLLLLAVGLWRWAVRRRRFPWMSTLAVAVVLFGILGLAVPWRRIVPPAKGTPFRVLELNANGTDGDGPTTDRDRLAALLGRTVPDVVVLAEWPADAVPPGGPWHLGRADGLLVASRAPIARSAVWSARPLGGEGRAVACQLTVAGRPLWVVGLHLETPRRGFEPVLHRAPDAAEQLRQSIARRRMLSSAAAAFVRQTVGGDDVVIAGDFNLVDDGAIYRTDWSAWPDAFARCGWGFGWTKYQDGWGVRIDHVLSGGHCRPRRCWVADDVGSDHRPVVADVTVTP